MLNRIGLTTTGCVLLAALLISNDGFAQGATVSYGRITDVRQVDMRNRSAETAGTLIGGTAGVVAGSGRSSSGRALRGAGGAALGRNVAGSMGSSTGFEYTVLINGSTIRIVTETSGLRVRDCVSVERGTFNNIRLAPDERCDSPPKRTPRKDVSAANACVEAKERLLLAESDEEFDRAERRLRLLCD